MDQATQHELHTIARRVHALEEAHTALNDKVDANTRITTSIKEDTSDLVEFAKAAKGLVTVGRWVGKVLTWLAPIAAVVLGAWATIKGMKS